MGDTTEDYENLLEDEDEELSVNSIIAKYSSPSTSPAKKISTPPATHFSPKSIITPLPNIISNTLEENCAVASAPLAWWSFLHKDFWMLVVEERDTVPFQIKLEPLQVTIYWTLIGIILIFFQTFSSFTLSFSFIFGS